MKGYSTIVWLHVVTAILGLGPLTVLALVTSGRTPSPLPPARLASWLRLVAWSLVGMLVTGGILVTMTHGAWARPRWMMAALTLFLLLGFLHSQAARLLRRTPTAPALNRILWTMCVLVAAIAYLMEVKPF